MAMVSHAVLLQLADHGMFSKNLQYSFGGNVGGVRRNIIMTRVLLTHLLFAHLSGHTVSFNF